MSGLETVVFLGGVTGLLVWAVCQSDRRRVARRKVRGDVRAFRRDRSVACGLAFLLGGLGVHKFYLGRPGVGLLYALFSPTLVPALLGWLDGFVLLSTSAATFDSIYNARPADDPAGPRC